MVRAAWFFLGILAVLLVPACLFAEAPRPRREGVVLACLKGEVGRGRAESALKNLGCAIERRLAGIEVEVVRIPKGECEETWSDRLVQAGLAEWAHPDYLVRKCVAPNDAYYSSQWHLPKIKANYAWDLTTGSASIVVAVVDTGVDASHVDLAGKVLAGYNAVTGGTTTTDTDGHGTASAGIVAAATNNGEGVAGVSWKSKILPVKVTADGSGDAYDSDIAEGWRWAADHGAKVISCSFGPLMESVFDSAAKYCESKGAVVLASSSNEGAEYAQWPDYASIVFVGATTSGDTRASFSSWGNYVDCTAPGTSIVTTSAGGGYEYFGGTSAACPVAAGVVALIRARNPGLTPAQAKSVLLAACDDKGTAGEDKYYGNGRVNAQRAVTDAGGAANVAPTISVSASTLSGTAPVTVSFTATAADSDGTIASISWSFGDGSSGSGASVSHTYASAGTFTATATATDNVGASASAAKTITVAAPADTTPPAKPLILSVVAGGTSGTLTLTWKANSEPDLSYYYVVRYDEVAGYVGVGTYGKGTTSIVDSGLVNGRTYYYWVRAYDAAGNKSLWSDYKYATPFAP